LNTKPLISGLEVEQEIPSVLATKLANGEYDAALLPMGEILQHPEYQLVDGVSISCLGPVYSVILAHEVPLEEILTVTLDSASVTSNLLFRILARDLIGHHVKYLPHGEKSCAQILIGDAAIHFRHDLPQIPVLDLGEAWSRLTGLPFVFAAWAIRPEHASAELAQSFRQARNLGVGQIGKIARTEFEQIYLTEHIRYDLGATEKTGILKFAEFLVTLGVIPQVPELHWI
jgi:predicted solute-binding protein